MQQKYSRPLVLLADRQICIRTIILPLKNSRRAREKYKKLQSVSRSQFKLQKFHTDLLAAENNNAAANGSLLLLLLLIF